MKKVIILKIIQKNLASNELNKPKISISSIISYKESQKKSEPSTIESIPFK